MATNKLGLTLLLVFGMILMGGNVEVKAQEDKICPLICFQVDYMTCPGKGYKRLDPVCNCCLAPEGCTLHLKDGQKLRCKKNN